MCVFGKIFIRLICINVANDDCDHGNPMMQFSQQRLSGLFAARVPRYTSYPPANHFNKKIDGGTQAKWLSKVRPGEPISLYLHIPFCKRLCWFCACRTQGTKSLEPLQSYVDILCRELDLIAEHLPKAPMLSRLNLGGGTPTILPSDLMAKLLNKVFSIFETGSNFEFAVEIDPTDATESVLRTLADFGMNRASIGVQDFEPEVQTAIGREQSYEQTNRVVELLKKFAIDRVNMDLVYGLPHQTMVSLQRTLSKVATLDPDRLAVYGYARVPWMSKRQIMIDETALPDSQERFELFHATRDFLIDQGFLSVGIDHFSKPHDGLAQAVQKGSLRRNFQGYTDDVSRVLIGAGASSISQFPQGYVQNHSATSTYISSIEQSNLAGARGHALSDKDMLISRMIENLMCKFALNAAEISKDFPERGSDIKTVMNRLSQYFPDACSYKNGQLEIHPSERFMTRVIAHQLDTYPTGAGSHAI